MARKKENRGGIRQGAGRKKTKPDSATISIRHDKDIIEKVRAKYPKGELAKAGRDWLEALVK